MGFARSQIWVQDYDESFYYYVMNHRKDNWARKIGWFLFEKDKVSFARLVVDNQEKTGHSLDRTWKKRRAFPGSSGER